MARASSTPARRKRPDSRRQELLDAALELLVTNGLSAPRVEDITEAAGAAKGTFYRYFASRSAIVDALRDQFASDFLLALEASISGVASGDWGAKIEHLVDASLDFALANMEAHNVLFHQEPIARNGERPGSERPFLHWFARFIADGVGAGEFSVSAPDLTATMLYAAFHGSLDLEAARPEFDRTRLRSSLVELYTRALKPIPGGRTSRARRAS